MIKINYHALREAAERATPAMERLLMLPVDDDLLSEQELKDYGVDIDALNAFKLLAGPETVLALLDERERNQQYIKRRDQENEDIALTVGKLRVELEGKDSKIANLTAERDALREGWMGDARHSNTRAAADIYFQLVEECEIPAGGSLVEYVDDMREKLEAAEKRIAELEAEPVSQTYKLNELSGNSPGTPDSWISCSERMPDSKTAVLVAREFDRKGDWRMKWATYIPGHPDANDGWIIPGASWKPSHWMPLPEPPQEVK
ncbi:ead/Ea22-like family protein [Escherichia coli]|uniref:ead/Ea22-like family protein n=2 Tax=Escherichia coli TaxID=562 RepID=UPI003B5EAF16